MFDIPIIYSIVSDFHPVFVAKRELTKGIPGISFPLRKLGSCLINRSNAKSSIKQLTEHGKTRVSTIFFPEGTRARTGELLPYNKAGLIALLRPSELETVNVLLDGAWRLTEKKSGPIPYGVKVKVKVDSPKRSEDLKSHMADIENWAKEELNKVRTS